MPYNIKVVKLKQGLFSAFVNNDLYEKSFAFCGRFANMKPPALATCHRRTAAEGRHSTT
jgi:hypothetical protein